MLAQEQVSFAPALAALAAALIVAGPVSVAVTKIVDLVRNAVGDRLPSWGIQVVALIAALALCLGWDINLANTVVQAIPALSDSDMLSGVGGTLVTALAVFGMSSFWHDKMAQWAAAHQGIEVITPMPAPTPSATTTRTKP